MSMPRPMIWLPLRAVVQIPGSDVVVDGGFELAGLPNWTPAGGAVLTRVAGTRTGGSGAFVANVAGNGGFIAPAVAPQINDNPFVGAANVDAPIEVL